MTQLWQAVANTLSAAEALSRFKATLTPGQTPTVPDLAYWLAQKGGPGRAGVDWTAQARDPAIAAAVERVRAKEREAERQRAAAARVRRRPRPKKVSA